MPPFLKADHSSYHISPSQRYVPNKHCTQHEVLKDTLSSWRLILFFFTLVKIIFHPIIELEQNKKNTALAYYNVLFCFDQVHQCNKYFVKKIMPENRDLNSKPKICYSHLFQNRAALMQTYKNYKKVVSLNFL